MMLNKISERYNRKDYVQNKVLNCCINSPTQNQKKSIKLNLENIQRSTSEQMVTPILNKQQSKQSSNISKYNKDGLGFGLTERELDQCSNEIDVLVNNSKVLLGTTLSVRSSHSNQFFTSKLADFSNQFESPKIKKEFKLLGKENTSIQQIQEKVDEMKVNYIKTSVTLNQQLNDNTRLLEQIEQLKLQQKKLSRNYSNSKSSAFKRNNNNDRIVDIKKSLDWNNKSNLLELIAKQQEVIKGLQSKLLTGEQQKQLQRIYNKKQSPQNAFLKLQDKKNNLIEKNSFKNFQECYRPKDQVSNI